MDADRGEHALGRAHLRDHQDRGQERHHREQQPQSGRRAPARSTAPIASTAPAATTPDQHLDPARRVHERHGEQHDEGEPPASDVDQGVVAPRKPTPRRAGPVAALARMDA